MATLCKLDIDDQAFSLYLLTQQNGDSLELRAFDGSESWTGKLTGGKLAEMAGKVSLDKDKFREETVKALTRQNLGILNFVYSVAKRGGGQMELIWKKHIIADNIKFLLGSVTLNVCRDQGATKLLDFAVSALEQNQQEIGDLQKENTRLSSERRGALARLEKCANLQQDIEKDLFGKFKVVLNEKKAKIRRLMDQLTTVSTQLSQVQQSSERVGSKAAAPGTAHGGMEDSRGSEDTRGGDHGSQDSDDQTDDEMAHSPSPTVAKEHAPLTPPSLPPPRLPMESLLGDPNERDITSPPVKRRKRNVGGDRPTSKVKGQPVELPRPPSISRSSSSTRSSGKVRVRSTSSESKRSEDSIESDDLLQLL